MPPLHIQRLASTLATTLMLMGAEAIAQTQYNVNVGNRSGCDLKFTVYAALNGDPCSAATDLTSFFIANGAEQVCTFTIPANDTLCKYEFKKDGSPPGPMVLTISDPCATGYGYIHDMNLCSIIGLVDSERSDCENIRFVEQ